MKEEYKVSSEQLQLLADNFNIYLQNKPWSNKRKEKVFTAFQDIMSRNITGTHYKDGIWYVDFDGDDIEFEDDKLKLYYGLAADYISSQIKLFPQQPKEEPKKEEPKKLKFDNDYFTSSFKSSVGNSRFGGMEDWSEGWSKLTLKKEILAQELEQYLKALNTENFDFTGTPFSGANDLNTRLTNAITALRTEGADAASALYRLGLNPDEWIPEDKPVVPPVNPVVPEDEPAATKLDITTARQNVQKYITLVGKHYWKPSGNTLNNLNYKTIFEKALTIGVGNLTHSENLKISNFISINGEPITSGKYSGGKRIANFPDIILFNGRLYQTNVLPQVAEDSTNLANLNKRKQSRNIAFVGDTITIGGKELSISNEPTVITLPNPLGSGIGIYGTKHDKYVIRYGGKLITLDPRSDLHINKSIKNAVIKLLQESLTPITTEEINQLKLLGWLKQGGIIDKLKMLKYKKWINNE